MSKASAKTKHPFNPMQIKDGWIVRMHKNGTVKERIEEYKPLAKKIK